MALGTAQLTAPLSSSWGRRPTKSSACHAAPKLGRHVVVGPPGATIYRPPLLELQKGRGAITRGLQHPSNAIRIEYGTPRASQYWRAKTATKPSDGRTCIRTHRRTIDSRKSLSHGVDPPETHGNAGF